MIKHTAGSALLSPYILILLLAQPVIGFAAEPGSIKWQYPLDAARCYSPAAGPDNTLYVPSNNRLIALTPDGTLKWSFAAGDVVSTPSVDSDGHIYFRANPNVYALDGNGNLLWQYTPTNGVDGRCAGLIAIHPNGTIYTIDGDGDGKIHAIDAATGLQKWRSTVFGGASYQLPGQRVFGRPDSFIWSTLFL